MDLHILPSWQASARHIGSILGKLHYGLGLYMDYFRTPLSDANSKLTSRSARSLHLPATGGSFDVLMSCLPRLVTLSLISSLWEQMS